MTTISIETVINWPKIEQKDDYQLFGAQLLLTKNEAVKITPIIKTLVQENKGFQHGLLVIKSKIAKLKIDLEPLGSDAKIETAIENLEKLQENFTHTLNMKGRVEYCKYTDIHGDALDVSQFKSGDRVFIKLTFKPMAFTIVENGMTQTISRIRVFSNVITMLEPGAFKLFDGGNNDAHFDALSTYRDKYEGNAKSIVETDEEIEDDLPF